MNQKLDVETLREAMEHSNTVRYVNVSDEELTPIQDRSLPEIIQHLLGNENVDGNPNVIKLLEDVGSSKQKCAHVDGKPTDGSIKNYVKKGCRFVEEENF